MGSPGSFPSGRREKSDRCCRLRTGNWQWRLRPNYLSRQLAEDIHELAATYGRTPKTVKEIK